MFVLSQPVAGTQVAGAIFLVDRKVVVDAELDHYSLVTGCILDWYLVLTDKMQLPPITVPDSPRLLDILYSYIWSGFYIRRG